MHGSPIYREFAFFPGYLLCGSGDKLYRLPQRNVQFAWGFRLFVLLRWERCWPFWLSPLSPRVRVARLQTLRADDVLLRTFSNVDGKRCLFSTIDRFVPAALACQSCYLGTWSNSSGVTACRCLVLLRAYIHGPLILQLVCCWTRLPGRRGPHWRSLSARSDQNTHSSFITARTCPQGDIRSPSTVYELPCGHRFTTAGASSQSFCLPCSFPLGRCRLPDLRAMHAWLFPRCIWLLTVSFRHLFLSKLFAILLNLHRAK